jgi:hypothetical protein
MWLLRLPCNNLILEAVMAELRQPAKRPLWSAGMQLASVFLENAKHEDQNARLQSSFRRSAFNQGASTLPATD